MIKNISSLGKVLSKRELQKVNGGTHDCNSSTTGGACSNTHNMCDYNYEGGDYYECMNVYGCVCYYDTPDGPSMGDPKNKPVILL